MTETELSLMRRFNLQIEEFYRWVSSNIPECKERRLAMLDLMNAEKWIRKAILSPNHYNFGVRENDLATEPATPSDKP